MMHPAGPDARTRVKVGHLLQFTDMRDAESFYDDGTDESESTRAIHNVGVATRVLWMPHLTSLDVSGSRDQAGIFLFSLNKGSERNVMPLITQLNFSRSRFLVEAASYLAMFPNLQRLRLQHVRGFSLKPQTTVAQIEMLAHLTELDVTGTRGLCDKKDWVIRNARGVVVNIRR